MKISSGIVFLTSMLMILMVAGCLRKEELPNIVYILCDDLGYGDVRCLNPEYGKIPTPNLDQLAKESMTFTDAHAGSSVCTPTRYGVLTGRYAWRTRLQRGVLGGRRTHDPLISESRLTVPSLLKMSGYNTACIGKWHLGFQFMDENGGKVQLERIGDLLGVPEGTIIPDGPVTRGFDTFYGFHHTYTMSTIIEDNKVIGELPPIRMLETLGDKAVRYIIDESKKDKPFFLYLALNSPHSPVVPSEDWQGKSGIGKYGDFVMETDDAVGRVMQALEESGIARNTLLIFTSDNGCSYPAANGKHLEEEFGHYPSAQYRGSKYDIWEGGHRIPFFVRWPGKVSPGTINEELVCLTDLMATCAEITGSEIPENAGEDSFSMLPLLSGKKNDDIHRAVVHHSVSGKFSIRKGNWKLEFCPGSGGDLGTSPTDEKARELGLPEIQLYNLETDEGEKDNVYNKYPEIVNKLTIELENIVDLGRSTDGEPQVNDVAVDIYKINK